MIKYLLTILLLTGCVSHQIPKEIIEVNNEVNSIPYCKHNDIFKKANIYTLSNNPICADCEDSSHIKKRILEKSGYEAKVRIYRTHEGEGHADVVINNKYILDNRYSYIKILDSDNEK